MSELIKAMKNGKRGKFRRVKGKIRFIRSEDGVVEKDAMTQASMSEDLGSPAAEVASTDKEVCKCGKCKECLARMQVKKDDDLCKCGSCKKCRVKKLDEVLKDLENRSKDEYTAKDGACPTCGRHD